ncbi:MAG TPA: 50S ribosomal protein L9 [Candidatus Kapabacteria bacterium]|nr:50S ribosomal protein L9 [Candidatus Kapabacteria bacterium]
MKVILRRDLDNLGAMGDLVTVKDGYARNFLIPRDLAYYASETAIKKLEAEKKQKAKKLAIEKVNAENLAAKLSELQVSIPMKVGEEGKLFGTVTSAMISAELANKHFEIDRRMISFDDTIKSLGVFDAKIKLHPEVVTTIKVWVISEEN